MHTKVISVTVRGYIKDETPFREIEFPVLNQSINDGYIIKQILTDVLPSSNGVGYLIYTFVLEK